MKFLKIKMVTVSPSKETSNAKESEFVNVNTTENHRRGAKLKFDLA